MKAYTIFDDFPKDAIDILEQADIDVTIHPLGVTRPSDVQMEQILQKYDIVIIGTSQKLYKEMLMSINQSKIIATASVGKDHIMIPEEKKDLITVINAPKANAQSVAEYTIACALSCCKRLVEGNKLYHEKCDNKKLITKPDDLFGKTFGVVGAGNISQKIMEYAKFFGMQILCWTKHPEKYKNLVENGVEFTSLDELAKKSDIISVNLPNNDGTKEIISEKFVAELKDTAIFISVSRLDTINWKVLIDKAMTNPNFYVCLDIDLNNDVAEAIAYRDNIMITPHIAGGTIQTRYRMFMEVAIQIARIVM